MVQGNAAAGYAIQGAPPPFPYPIATFGGVQGEIRQPIISDPISTTDQRPAASHRGRGRQHYQFRRRPRPDNAGRHSIAHRHADAGLHYRRKFPE